METTSESEEFHLYTALATSGGISPTIAVKVSVSLREDGCHVEGETANVVIRANDMDKCVSVLGECGCTLIKEV